MHKITQSLAISTSSPVYKRTVLPLSALSLTSRIMVAVSRTRITALHARNLATLSQTPTSTSTLTPPYSHSINSAQPKFRPPYAHSISSPSTAKLAAPYKYSLVPPSRAHDEKRVESFNSWARGLLQSDKGRAQVWKAWADSVADLDRIKAEGVSSTCMLQWHLIIS